MQAGTIAAPKRLEDLNLRRDLVASLVLRTLAFADQLSGAALEARLGLPFETVEPIIQEFQKLATDRLLDQKERLLLQEVVQEWRDGCKTRVDFASSRSTSV